MQELTRIQILLGIMCKRQKKTRWGGKQLLYCPAMLLSVCYSFTGRQYRLTSFCDSVIKVHLDGVLVGSASWQNPNPETGILTINIDSNTSVVGIECYDPGGFGAMGIIASLSTGLVTDESWVCSAQYVENWEQPGFQATGSLWTSASPLSEAWWSTSHDMSPWATYVWTPNTGDQYGYCRRDLDIGR